MSETKNKINEFVENALKARNEMLESYIRIFLEENHLTINDINIVEQWNENRTEVKWFIEETSDLIKMRRKAKENDRSSS